MTPVAVVHGVHFVDAVKVAKVEHLPRGENPRYIVTSIPVQKCEGRRLYEEIYCARGEMENRIKDAPG